MVSNSVHAETQPVKGFLSASGRVKGVSGRVRVVSKGYLVRPEGYLVGPRLSGIKIQARSKGYLGGSDVEGYEVCISIIILLSMQLSH